MKGKILGFNASEGVGAISAEDGSRYKFSLADWRGDRQPLPGTGVDFESADGIARDIYPVGGMNLSGLGAVDFSGLSAGGSKAVSGGQVGALFTQSLAAPLALAVIVACFMPALSTPQMDFSLIDLGDAVNAVAAGAAAMGEDTDMGGLKTLLILRFAAPLAALWLIWSAWSGRNERLSLLIAGGAAFVAAVLPFMVKSSIVSEMPDFIREQAEAGIGIGFGPWLLILAGAALVAAGLGVIRNPMAK